MTIKVPSEKASIQLEITEPFRLERSPDYKYRFRLGDNYIVCESETQPNRFHRFMQKLILGIHWEKL